jgi:hypothetical protein
MEIKCRYIGEITSCGGRMTIRCGEVRHDLLIDEIINEKGIDYVLNAIGGDDILKYLTSKG